MTWRRLCFLLASLLRLIYRVLCNMASVDDATWRVWVKCSVSIEICATHNVNQMPRTILAVASGGGHWIELLRLRPAFEGHRVEYVTVRADYRGDVAACKFHQVNDATGWSYFALLQLLFRVGFIVLKVRPDVVISTGAAPGYFAIRLGKLLGAKTIWVDSLANVEELSRAGQLAGPHADLWLTQWPKLAKDQGPEFAGQVL